MLAAITGEYVRGADVNESPIHPFRKHFEDLKTGDSLLTHRRTVSEADIVAFGGISGDFFYMHFDEIAAKESQFGKRIAHGYFELDLKVVWDTVCSALPPLAEQLPGLMQAAGEFGAE